MGVKFEALKIIFEMQKHKSNVYIYILSFKIKTIFICA
jgi:hypothetical protein